MGAYQEKSLYLPQFEAKTYIIMMSGSMIGRGEEASDVVVPSLNFGSMSASVRGETPPLPTYGRIHLGHPVLLFKKSENLETRDLLLSRPFSRRNSCRRTNPAVKSAIYTMLAIVTSYLASNTLHLILSILAR